MLHKRLSGRLRSGIHIIDYIAEAVGHVETQRETCEFTGKTEISLIDTARALILQSAELYILSEGVTHR